ncbi:molybdopterin-binding protein [Halanaerocella petrolearia]
MSDLFNLVEVVEVFEILEEKIDYTLGSEKIKVTQARERTLATDIKSKVDLPPFSRSTMDGYAVRAEDTFGASEFLPIFLDLVGEVEMGEETQQEVKSGQAIKIATGGMLPAGADAVVMVEYTEELGTQEIEVTKAVAPGENIVTKGEDISSGDTLLETGKLLRPQDIGALTGIGVTEVEVFAQPEVTVFSTGDELIAPDKEPKLGQIRDINSYSIGTLVEESGAVTTYGGIIPDKKDQLRDQLAAEIDNSDLVILSGGSSVGVKDLTVDVFNQLGQPGVLIHGVSIKPGKPTILALVDETPVIGLPGHPASALVVGEMIVKPLLQRLAGREGQSRFNQVVAKVNRNIISTKGREEYIRVSLTEKEGQLWANPILGKSSLITTLVKADGLVKVGVGQEGIAEGTEVEVLTF